MADALVKQLVEAGVHFGHRASRWNPKMGPYIYGRQKLIHIIDVRETVRGLLRARKYFKQVAASGSLILFVGTKRQAADTVEREAQSALEVHVLEGTQLDAGDAIEVEWLEFLRGEQKFETEAILRAQIAKDVAWARARMSDG